MGKANEQPTKGFLYLEQLLCDQETAMWHKLREIFGYKDTRQRQVEVTENKMDKTDENGAVQEPTDQSHKSEENINSSAGQSVSSASKVSVLQSNNDSSFSTWTKIKDKWNDDCFECRVTVSVVTFCLLAHVCRSLWSRRLLVPQSKRKSIVIANLSLLGMWLCYMKQEWYDEKVDTNEQKKNFELSWDMFKR